MPPRTVFGKIRFVVLPLSTSALPRDAPVDAEAAAEALRGFDDPRLDDDLRRGGVQVVDELEHGRQVGRDLADDQRVGPRVDDDRAALGHDALQRRDDFRGLRVGQLLDDRAGRLGGLARLGEAGAVGLFRLQLRGRRDAHDVVLEHVAEAVLLEDQVERLVPGNVLELDRDRAADLGVDHDVEAGQLGDRAEDVLDVGVFQVERDRLAGELGLRLGDRPRAVLIVGRTPTAPGRARPRRLRRALRRGWTSARTWPDGRPGRAPEPVRGRPAAEPRG